MSLSDLTIESSRVGAEMIAGVQWAAGRWAFGAALRSPALLLHHDLEARYLVATVVPGEPPRTDVDVQPVPQQRVGIMLPARLSIGGAIRVGAGHASVEVELAHRLDRPGNQLTSLWNVRASIRQQLTPTVAIGAGLFTDRSAQPTPTVFCSGRRSPAEVARK